MKHKIGNIVGIALIVIFLPIVIVNATLAVKGSMNPDKVATFLGYGPLAVETGSMKPEFKEGDLIIVKETGDANALAKDDIIAYYSANGTVVSHRILGYTTEDDGARLYITKGDANNTQDKDGVPATRVIGLIVKVIPDGGKTMETLRQPMVMGLIIVIPLALWFGYTSLMKALARKKEEGGKSDSDEPRP